MSCPIIWRIVHAVARTRLKFTVGDVVTKRLPWKDCDGLH